MKNTEEIIEWDENRPEEMKRLIMAGKLVRIPVKKFSHCDSCDHWDMCEGCPYTDERGDHS